MLAGIAVAVLAVVLATVFIVLPRNPTTSRPAPAARHVPAGTVAVVRSGPAVIEAQPFGGGAATQSLVLPGAPTNIVTTPDGSKAYLLDTSHGTVVPVDLAHSKVGAAIPVGKLPVDQRISADGATLYVTDNLNGDVVAVDTATDSPGTPQPLAAGVRSFVPAPKGSGAVVSFFGASGEPGELVFIGGANGQSQVVRVGANPPTDAIYSRDGTTVWVTESGLGNKPGVLIPVDVTSQTPGPSLPLGRSPAPGSLTADGRLLLVPDRLDGTLTVVDVVKRTVSATIPVCAGAGSVRITADAATGWVSCGLDRRLAAVNLPGRTAGAAVSLANAPADLVLSPSGSSAWVLYPESAGSLARFDAASNTLGAAIAVGNGPQMLIAHDSSSAWVANSVSDTVQQVNTATATAGPAISVPRTPEALVLTPDHSKLLVLSFGDGTHSGSLTAIDTARSTAGPPLDVGPAPGSVVLSSDGARAFIDNHDSNQITTVDVKAWQVGHAVALPCSPTDLAITPDGHSLYAACSSSRQVLPIPTTSLQAGNPIAVGPDPALVMESDGSKLLVSEAHRLELIDVAGNVVERAVPERGNLIAFATTPGGGSVVTIDNVGNALLLINPRTFAVKVSVPLTGRPDSVALSLDGTQAYVLDTGAQKLYVVDTGAARVIATVPVGPNAQAIAVPAR